MVYQGTNRNRSAARKRADTLHVVGGRSTPRAASGSPTPVRSLQDSPGLRALISDMPSAIALFDRDLKCLAASEGWLIAYAEKPVDSPGRRRRIDSELSVPDRWRDAYARCLAGETAEVEEDSPVGQDGRIRRMRLTFRPWHDTANCVGGGIVMSEEVTDLGAAITATWDRDRQLTAELAVLRRLQRIAPALVRNPDLSGLAQEVVNAAVTLTGADAGTLQLVDEHTGDLRLTAHVGFGTRFLNTLSTVPRGQPVCSVALFRRTRVIVEDVSTCAFLEGTAALEAMLQAGIRAVCSTPLVTCSGDLIGTVSTQFREPHVFSDGQLRALDLLAHQGADMVAQSRAQLELRTQRDHLQSILATAVDAIITIDNAGVIQSVNPSAERMFGYTAAEMVGQQVSMLMPELGRSLHDGFLTKRFHSGMPHIITTGRELPARRKDGSLFPAELAIGRNDRQNSITGFIRDISARKLAEDRLRESERLVGIGTLAAGLGHDMNNMLLPVRARLNALSSETNRMSAQGSQNLTAITKHIAYLQELADGLHFLAMDPEQTDHRQMTTDLAAWWRHTRSVLTKALPRHVKLHVSIPRALPLVGVAPHSLTQAMLNLLVNAADAMASGPPDRSPKIALTAAMLPPHRVRLSVSDNGCGMTEETRRHAFDMFFTTKPRGLGTGLGLALVRRIAEQPGGQVHIDSRLDHGTTVTMSLPAVAVNERPALRMQAILSVRDGRTASVIRHLLEGAGMDVSTADAPGDADVWIVEPDEQTLRAARTWKARKGVNGRLVTLGLPRTDVEHADWRDLSPLTIPDPNDLVGLRSVLTIASSSG